MEEFGVTNILNGKRRKNGAVEILIQQIFP